MIRAALIGAGWIASQHAKGLAMMDRVDITAVVDVNEKSAEKMAQEYGAKAFIRVEDGLDDADAVWIFTPPSSHKNIAIKAMEKGKHVFCEKPISITLADAKSIYESSQKNDVVFMTGFNMRFRKSYRKMKEIVASGEIGEVINFWSHRVGLGAGSTSGWKGYNWRTDKKLMCGMSIESLSHDIDMMRWIAGEVKGVNAVINESLDELPGFDDNANVNFLLENGAVGNIFASWSSYITQNSRGVIGTKGTVIIEGSGIWNVDRIRVMTSDMDCEIVETVTDDTLDYQSYYYENMHFVNCIEKDIKPMTDARDGHTILKISHAILDSAKLNRMIEI
jgi:myo-inositol 2-dehydrogenase/D-chiro-inositol 1-dehydrogenase